MTPGPHQWKIQIILSAALKFELAVAGAEITVGPQLSFCLSAPDFALKGILIGRFMLTLEIEARASASSIIGVHASASTSSEICVGLHFGVGAIATVEAKIKGAW